MLRRFPAVGGAAVALALAATTLGQYPKLITDFEEPDFVEFVTLPMFNLPSFSTATRGLDPADGELTYLTNVTIDTFSRASSPPHSCAAFWGWLDPGDPSSWVRLDTLNNEVIPNPALHLGGKVRLMMAATAYTDATFGTAVTTGNLFLGLGVRETGQGVPKGGDGGAGGDVEWVGLDAVLAQIFGGTNGTCDTTADPNSDDVQVIASGQPAGPGDVCVDAGPDGVLQTAAASDDVTRTTPRGRFNIPSDGVMRAYEFDLPAEETAGNVYGFTGDGVLDGMPNDRGTLGHLVLTNDPVNDGVNAKVWLVNVDDVTFESPIPDPPVISTEPAPLPLDSRLFVTQIDAATDTLDLVRFNLDGSETVLYSRDPNGTETNAPVDPLAAGLRVVARQTIGGDMSDDSVPVIVASPGNGPLRIAMGVRETDAFDDPNCASDGTGFDPDQPSTLEFIGSSGQPAGFGIPDAPRYTTSPDWFEVQFNPCDETFGVAQFSGNGVLDLNPPPAGTIGVWEGLYFRVDAQTPTPGPYQIFIDDVQVKNASTGATVCLVDDFETYTPASFVVADFGGNGMADTFADPNSDDIQVVTPGTTTFAGQIVVDPGPDNILQTTPDGDDGTSPLHARFNFPGVAGTSVGLADTPDLCRVTDEQAFSGSQSLEIRFGFLDASNLRSVLRLTTNGSLATNPPETFIGPDPVIPFSEDGTFCDGSDDLVYSVMIRLAPPEVPGDCDGDGDVDLADAACMQQCFGEGPVSQGCLPLDIAPKAAPDDTIDFADVGLFRFLLIGPISG